MTTSLFITMITSTCIGIALSASSGFRVFLPMLAANLAARFGGIQLNSGFEWLASSDATIIFIVASIVEIASFYIVLIDNLLDAIAVPAAMVAGSILSSSMIPIDSPVIHWGLGIIAGGGTAGTIQAGTGLLRLTSTKFTGTLGNPIFTTVENVLAVVIIALAFVIPVIVSAIIIYFLVKILKWVFVKKTTNTNI
jgi:hypothetical protein